MHTERWYAGNAKARNVVTAMRTRERSPAGPASGNVTRGPRLGTSGIDAPRLRYRALMKRSLPWLSSLLAGVLLFTPTYGIGLAISPLTLIGSTIALSPLARATRAVRIGAAVNLLVLVAGLSLLTAIWVTTAGAAGLFLFAIA